MRYAILLLTALIGAAIVQPAQQIHCVMVSVTMEGTGEMVFRVENGTPLSVTAQKSKPQSALTVGVYRALFDHRSQRIPV